MTDVVGLRFVTEGYEDAVARLNEYKKVTTATTDVVKNVAGATRGIESSLKQLNAMYDSGAVAGQAYRRAITELGAQFAALSGKSAAEGRQAILALNQAMEAQRVKTEELAAARQRAETGYALAIQRHREEAAAQQAAAQAKERAKQGYDQLRASIDPVIAAQQRYAEAERRVNAAVQQGIVTREQGNATLAAYRLRLGDLSRTALDADNITGRLRQQFLATANSIAILDGPLGGVASRFSAFGVLIGRTGLLIGTALVGFAAFGAVLNRGVRNLVEWEAQTARINAVLSVTRGQVGLTSAEIERMASSIALNTLESERGVRAAAARLLTFRDIAGSVFEDVLKSATDMAALGFGTVESESTKLAKALEDPAQALTSLSRAGIVFTRQQRQVIISLVESGRRAEAMDRILQNVRARTQGAAEAAAAGTLAGAFDTIGQAVSRATRDFAEWTLTITGARAAIEAIAAGVSDYAAGQKGTADQLRESEAAVKSLREEMERAQAVANRADVRAFGTAALRRGERLPRAVQAELDAEERRVAALREQLDIEQRLARVSRATSQVARDAEGLDNLRTALDLRRDTLGLAEEHAQVQRMLAQEGLRNIDVEARINALVERRNDLLAQGVDTGLIQAMLERYRKTLADVATTAEELVQLAQQERDLRTAMATSQDLQQRNALLQAQIAYVQQGLTLTEARQRAEDDVTRALLESALAAGNLPPEIEAALRQALALVGTVRNGEAALNAAADAAERLRGALAAAANVSLGLDDRIAGLRARVGALKAGADQYTASAREQLELERRRLDVVIRTGDATQRIAAVAQRGIIASQLEEIATLEREAAGFRGGKTRGGSGASKDTFLSMFPDLQRAYEEAQRLAKSYKQEVDILDSALARNIITQTQYNDMLRQAQENYGQVVEQARKYQDELQRVGQTMENAMTNAFMSIVDGTKTAEDAFRDMARTIIAELYKVLVVQQLVGSWDAKKNTGTGIVGALMGGLSKALGSVNANGNVFTPGMGGPNVIPFARGGVVGSPTVFPMAGGRTGLMGEAGPEAIMPLKRGKDGKLGVQAQGGSTVHIVQNFSVAANGDESVKRIVAQQVPAIAEATKAAVLDARKRGGQMRAAFK
jgi:lambda family phage tail tape measure protein